MYCRDFGAYRAVLTLLILTVCAAGALAQTAQSVIDVVPLARSAAFTFRLDQVAPTRFSKEDFGPLFEPIPSATLEWRLPGQAGWKKAQPFVRLQADRNPKSPLGPDPRMGTMLFGLKEGETYEYRVAWNGTGFPTTPVTGQFKTLTSNVPVGAAKVVPITISPKTTSAEIRAALATALSDTPAQNAGKIIELRSSLGPNVRTVVRAALSSIYANGQWSWSGTKDAWLTVRTAPGHQIIFDGSDPAYDVVNANKWQPVSDAALGLKTSDAVYVSADSMPRPSAIFYEPSLDAVGIRLLEITRGETFIHNWIHTQSNALEISRAARITSLSRAEGAPYVTVTTETDSRIIPGDWVTISGSSRAAWNIRAQVAAAVRDDAKGVYTLQYLAPDGRGAATATGGTVTPEQPHSVAQDRVAANGGFFAWVPDAPGGSTGKVYLRLHNGRNPNSVYIKIPVLSSCLDLGSTSFLNVDGIDIRYFGWFGGIGLIDVADTIVQNCTLRNLTFYIGHRTSTNSYKRRVIIKHNRMEEKGLGPDPDDPAFPAPQWTWVKASKQEQIGIPMYGRGISLIDNHIQGMFNGTSGYVGMQSMNFGDAQVTYPEAWEIDGNTFVGIGDDSIEPEQWAVNYAVVNNTFKMCYKGVSLAPATGGPYFVLRNHWLGRGEYTVVADKQAFLKMGNDHPGDPAYKLIAHNTMVNINANPNGNPLVGIANSGATFNHHYYNNYVASDGYPIDMGYGAMGYPHIFDGNRYRALRFADRIPNYDLGFGIGKMAWSQGEPIPGSDHRTAATFDDWQRGRSVNNSPNWPGYDGSVPTTPRIARTPGANPYAPETVAWLHDPHGSFSQGAPELVSAFRGDFRPASGTPLIGGGVPLANISFDCGPAWDKYEESGRPTVGALPGASSGTRANDPPTVTADPSAVAIVGKPISVAVTYADWDGTVQAVTAVVTDPQGKTVDSSVVNVGDGVSSVVFTPPVIGAHTLKVTARDDDAATTDSSVSVNVLPDLPTDGQLAITMRASKAETRPGEPVVYTFEVSNPTLRTMRDAILRQALPPQMVFNTASLQLDGRPTTGTFANGSLQLALGTMGPGERRVITVTAFVQ